MPGIILALASNNYLKIGNPYLGSMMAVSINCIVLLTRSSHSSNKISGESLLYNQNQNGGNRFLESNHSRWNIPLALMQDQQRVSMQPSPHRVTLARRPHNQTLRYLQIRITFLLASPLLAASLLQAFVQLWLAAEFQRKNSDSASRPLL